MVSYFGRLAWYHSTLKKNFSTCYQDGYLNISQLCIYSNYAEDFRNSDAMVIRARYLKGNEMRDLKKEQSKRNPNQSWIFFENEPPFKLPGVKLKHLDGMFNLTATFSTDSDLPKTESNRLRTCHRNTTLWESLRDKNFVSKKRTDVLAAWFVSVCRSQSQREKYVEELKKYMKVDIYGHCSKKKCGSNNPGSWAKDKCNENLLHNNNSYMFYLSFENSFCKDYVTEKLWKVEKLDVVPVVMGGVDYASMMPADSYIDVKNFSSPKQLAHYLKHVAANHNLYNSYIRNRKSLKCVPRFKFIPWHCKLCQFLYETRGMKKTVKVSEFWGAQRCMKPSVYYTNIEKLQNDA